MPLFAPMPVEKAYQSYKPGRDLALDVVRSWALLVVVVGHFLMLIVFWAPGNVAQTSNTLASGAAWPWVTWLMQIMPLFFIAGGAVNKTSWENFSAGYAQWLWGRVSRLMRPTVVFLGFMVVFGTVATLALPASFTDPLMGGITGPLWFLAVYIPVVALTPLTAAWFDRQPLISTVVLFIACVVIDVLRFKFVGAAGVANLLLAWVFVHQLGYWYSKGVSRRVASGLIVLGLLANVVLTNLLAWYPISLVGIPSERFSNMSPPDMILVFHALVLFGLFVLLAPWLRTKFVKEKALKATIVAGMVAMTVYLWHMLVLLCWLTLLHFTVGDLPTRVYKNLVLPDGPTYWLWLVPVLVGFLAILYVVVRLLWPLEYVKLPVFDTRWTVSLPPRFATLFAAVGATLLGVGILALAGLGFSGFPTTLRILYGVPVNAAVALVVIVLGLACVKVGAGGRKPVPV